MVTQVIKKLDDVKLVEPLENDEIDKVKKSDEF